MTVVCTNCEKTYEVEPKVCTECSGVEFIALEESVTEEIEEIAMETTNMIGFRGVPAEIRNMFNLISLPTKGSSYTFPSFVLTKKGNDIYINQALGSSIAGFYRFYETGFFENWGEGQIPFNSEKALSNIDDMRYLDAVSVSYDIEQGIISYFSGKKDIISNRTEIVESINTCPDITENHSMKPYPFNERAFCPILKSETNFENGYSFKVNTSELKALIKRAERFNADFYPFVFNKDCVEVGVNDMKNPDGEGAFVKQIECDIINAPSEEITVELGKTLAHIVNNVNGDIEMVFAGSNLPIWIRGELTDDVGNVTGKFGFVLPPRTA